MLAVIKTIAWILERLYSLEDIYQYLSCLGNRLTLARNSKVLNVVIIQPNPVMIVPPTPLNDVVTHVRQALIVLIHNHNAGDPSPSISSLVLGLYKVKDLNPQLFIQQVGLGMGTGFAGNCDNHLTCVG
jgi:hypothetical protein